MFFKKVKRKFAVKGTITKYLLYAIGEIVLIVIGIVIALQLNNGNEAHKKREVEIKSYMEIKDDLDKTLKDIDYDLNRHRDYLYSTVLLRAHLLKNDDANDSLSFYLSRSSRDFQLFPKTGAFESLKSRGLEILSNDSLRLNITDLYQLGIDNLISLGREASQTRNINKIMEPYLNKHLTISTQIKEMVNVPETSDSIAYYRYDLLSYENLKNDKDLLGTLEKVIQIRIFKMQKHVALKAQMDKVIRDIEKELERLKK